MFNTAVTAMGYIGAMDLDLKMFSKLTGAGDATDLDLDLDLKMFSKLTGVHRCNGPGPGPENVQQTDRWWRCNGPEW